MQRHIQTHTDDYAYQCSLCDRKFQRKDKYKNHIKVHTKKEKAESNDSSVLHRRRGRPRIAKSIDANYCEEEGRYRCSICLKTFAWRKDMQRHTLTHSDSFAYQCYLCDRKFQRKDKFKEHIKVHAKKDNIGENDINLLSGSPWIFATHLYSEQSFRLIKCKKCDTTYPTISALRQHLATHTDDSMFQSEFLVSNEQCAQSDIQTDGVKSQGSNELGKLQYFEIVNAYGYEMSLSDSDEDAIDGARYECELCSLSFMRKYQIFKHVKMQHAQEHLPYKCNVCKMEFVCKNMHLSHERTQCCNNIKTHHCPKCPGRFMFPENFENHQCSNLLNAAEYKRSKNKTSIKTNLVNELYGTQLKQQYPHAQRHIECCLCGEQFERLSNLRLHLGAHADGVAELNKIAGKYFEVHWPQGCTVEDAELTGKIAADFAEQNIIHFYLALDKCGNELDLNDSETDPAEDDEIVPPKYALYTCELCGVSFCRRKYILMHQQEAHSQAAECLPHACADCGQRFVCLTLLDQHIARDCRNDMKKFRCEKCPARFVWEANLQRHTQSKHTDSVESGTVQPVKRLQCEFCDKTFIWPKNLSRHRRVHTPDGKKFECPYCERKFVRKDNMQAHLKVHGDTGNKRSLTAAEVGNASTSKKECKAKATTNVAGVDVNLCQPHGCKHIQCKLCLSVHSKIADLRTHLQTHQKGISIPQQTRSVDELCTTFYPDEPSMSETQLSNRIKNDISAGRLARFYSITTELGYELSISSSDTDSDSEPETDYVFLKDSTPMHKVYKCDLCDLPFKRKYKLYSHQLQEHKWEQAPHECTQCGARFLCKPLLQSHQKQLCKNTLKRHMCRKCPQRFMWKENLTTHLCLLHAESMDIKKLTAATFDCVECDRKFQMQKDLTRHMLMHRSDGFTFKCLWCRRKFFREENLHMHLRCHDILPEQLETARCHISASTEPNGTKEIYCRICKVRFNTVTALRAHLAQQTAANNSQHHPYNSLANYSIVNQLGFEIQIDDSDTDVGEIASGVGLIKQYKCEICGLVCKRRFEMARHQHSIHKPEQLPLKCDNCIFKTVCKEILQHHMQSQCYNNEKQYQCEKCNFRFMWPENLEIHIKKLHASPAGALLTDPTTLPAPTGMETETAAVTTSDKQFKCDKCHRCYNRKDRLTTHYKKVHMHSGISNSNGSTNELHKANEQVSKTLPAEKKFLCAFCGRAMTSMSNLIIHMRRHTGEKPFKCEFCDMAFPRSSDLQCHRRTHTGEKPHTCTVCGKAFSRSYKLHTHMRIHSGERPYKCTYCEKSFTQSNDLTLHVRRHTGERPYVCGICGERFIQGTALKNHRTMRGHYEDTEPQCSGQLQQS